MAQYDDINYLTFIRTGVLNSSILEGALDQVHRGGYKLYELRDSLEEGLETAIENNRKFLEIDFHTEYLENVLSDLREGRETDIYEARIPAETLEIKRVLELAAA